MARQEEEVTINTIDGVRVRLRAIDRISVDDVFLHLIHGELSSIITGEDRGADVNRKFRDFVTRPLYQGR